MSTYPTTPRTAFLAWAQTHQPIFSDNAAQLGLSAPQALAFKNAEIQLAAAMAAVDAARSNLAATVEGGNTAYSNMRRIAGDTVRTIRAFAENSNNPSAVYQLAQIPSPKVPAPVPPPAQPTDIAVGINPTSGAIELTWKASNPTGSSGTSYIIRRRTSNAAEFAFIGVTGSKRFVDSTFTAGPDSVQYTIQGQRADSTGPVSAIVIVNFGRAPGGGAGGAGGAFVIQSVQQGGEGGGGNAVKLAA